VFIGEVVGSVIATQKTANMDSLSLRVVRKIAPNGQPTAGYAVAVDVVGASEGEYVLVATGSTARQTPQTDYKPIDAIIMAIVDTWQIEGQVQYQKNA
jgi:microcompartment protein CcmK/EutM